MTTFPGSPRLSKGALLGLDPASPLASVVIFQYNPKTLTRRLEPTTAKGDGARSEVLRLTGAPKETFEVKVAIDATDQLERGDSTAVAMGIHPQLAALEMLLYPKTPHVIANSALLAAGVIQVLPPSSVFTLFVWGNKRVLPVRLESFSVEEQEFDPALNPIRAEVTLGLRVLSYNDFSVFHPGFGLFMAHQVVKEVMATLGSVGNVGAVLDGSVRL